MPVEHEQGRFRVQESWLPLSALDVTLDERLAFAIARRSATILGDTVIGRALDRLWSKLVSPGQQQLALDAPAWIQVSAHPGVGGPRHAAVIETLRLAISEGRPVRLRYRKLDGTESLRIVEPLFVVLVPQMAAVYVRAWCRLREAFRTFAVHRIVCVEPQAGERSHRDGLAGEPAAPGAWCGERNLRVVVQFSAAVAPEICERRWYATQRITELAAGEVRFEVDVTAADEILRWILGFGPDATVLEPPSLVALVHQRHSASVAASADVVPAGAPRAGTRIGTQRRSPRAARRLALAPSRR